MHAEDERMENVQERRENVEWEVVGVGAQERMAMRGRAGEGVEQGDEVGAIAWSAAGWMRVGDGKRYEEAEWRVVKGEERCEMGWKRWKVVALQNGGDVADGRKASGVGHVDGTTQVEVAVVEGHVW